MHGGWVAGATLESVIASALRTRGVHVDVLLCDGVLPACFECEHALFSSPSQLVAQGPQQAGLCADCSSHAMNMYETLGVRVLKLSDFLSDGDRQQARSESREHTLGSLKDWVADSIPMGEHALAGALRFYGRADFSGEPEGEAVAQRYAEAASLVKRALEKVFDKGNYTTAVFHHGIYVPQGIVGACARNAGVRVVNWNPIWRKGTFIFSHGDTYHHTLLTDPNSEWDTQPLESWQDELLTDYLDKRRHGTDDWIWFHKEPIFDKQAMTEELGIDFSKPVIGLLTNVLWDAQLHYRDNAFPSLIDWLVETVEYFRKRKDLQLLVRVHPAEVRGIVPSRQPVMKEIERRIPDMPDNVFIIRPESHISTYAAMDTCDTVLIYGTKTGLELSAQGKPVIVAGEAWIRNKGFAKDVCSRDEYFACLDELPAQQPLAESLQQRARQYAYHFIFRRMIPVTSISPGQQKGQQMALQVPNQRDVQPGKDTGLDVICEGIIDGKPFIYPHDSVHAKKNN